MYDDDDLTEDEIIELLKRRDDANEARKNGRQLRCGCWKYKGEIALFRWGCPIHNTRVWWWKLKKRILPPW